jgi:hypothetical protein
VIELVKKITIEIDVSKLDEEIAPDQIQEIILCYHNIGENTTWQQAVPHKIIKVE